CRRKPEKGKRKNRKNAGGLPPSGPVVPRMAGGSTCRSARQSPRHDLSYAAMPVLKTARGRSLPLGATALADGVNFALLCRHGTAVRLVLLPVDGEEPVAEISLDPLKNRTGDHWHVLVAGLPQIFRYGWRVHGPQGGGHRFNPEHILLDPSSTAIA